MKSFLAAWAAVAVIMLPLDAVWLKTMRPFYESRMGDLLLAEPRIPAAAGFYLLYAAAVAFFAVRPNLSDPSLLQVAAYGAFFGLAAYSTYDMTNYATLKAFPLTVALVDMAWGTLLTATAATGAWAVMRWFD